MGGCVGISPSHTRRREKGRRVFLFTSLLRHTLAKKPLLSSPAVAAWSKVQGTDSVAASASVAAAKEGGTDRPTPLKALFLNFFLLLPPPPFFFLNPNLALFFLLLLLFLLFGVWWRGSEREEEREREREREKQREEKRRETSLKKGVGGREITRPANTDLPTGQGYKIFGTPVLTKSDRSCVEKWRIRTCGHFAAITLSFFQ